MSDVIEGVSQDSKNTALLVWVGTIFFGFVPGLILFLVKKDDPYVYDQSKEALNWSITVAIAVIAASILAFALIGFFLLPLIGLCNLIFCVLGAIGASKGETFRVPFALRFLK
ncbi:MAG: DUF4870 domain-containing protein [Betaproteobacteria bacterium]|nr:DUF4870 domain-containing protein [Betaproteobacteria bacterium]MCL2887314.1 DUF4870 domain-containing protein [Betaproteobacteria bacterium]